MEHLRILNVIIGKQTFLGGGIIRYGKYNKLADVNMLMVRILGVYKG
jgi:hypothetical protein